MDSDLLRVKLHAVMPVAEKVLASHPARAWGMLPMHLGSDVEDLQPLLGLLKAQSEFATFRGHVDGYGTPMSPEYIFGILLKVAVDRGPDAAVKWLEKVLATEIAAARCYFLLSGLKDIEHTITLSPTLRLERFDQLEEMTWVQWFRPLAAGGGPWGQHRLPANVVLVRDVQVPKFTTNALKGVLHPALLEMELLIHLLGIFQDAMRPEAGWNDYVDADLQEVRLGIGHYPASTDVRAMMAMQEAPRVRTYRRLAAAYEALDEGERAVVGVAAQRLNEASQRRRRGDRAIDAAICIEALVGDDDDKTEVSKTARTRSALALGGGFEKRRLNRDAVRDLYNTRSKMVHKGRLTAKLDQDKFVAPGVRVARKVLLSRLLFGKPDWDRLELQGHRWRG